MRSSFDLGAVSSTTTLHGTPASRAAYATPCPALPALIVQTPRARSAAGNDATAFAYEHLRENDVVQAKVIAIKEDGKIDLSIKALQDPPPQRQRRGSDPDFEARLKKFMRQSEERQVDFKRSVEHKRK